MPLSLSSLFTCCETFPPIMCTSAYLKHQHWWGGIWTSTKLPGMWWACIRWKKTVWARKNKTTTSTTTTPTTGYPGGRREGSTKAPKWFYHGGRVQKTQNTRATTHDRELPKYVIKKRGNGENGGRNNSGGKWRSYLIPEVKSYELKKKRRLFRGLYLNTSEEKINGLFTHPWPLGVKSSQLAPGSCLLASLFSMSSKVAIYISRD